MTGPTEYRSGDVTVTSYDPLYWNVLLPLSPLISLIPKEFAPNGQALAEFIDSQQSAPRYYVPDNRDPQQPGLRMICDRNNDGRVCASAPSWTMAIRIAELLNAAEAEK